MKFWVLLVVAVGLSAWQILAGSPIGVLLLPLVYIGDEYFTSTVDVSGPHDDDDDDDDDDGEPVQPEDPADWWRHGKPQPVED